MWGSNNDTLLYPTHRQPEIFGENKAAESDLLPRRSQGMGA